MSMKDSPPQQGGTTDEPNNNEPDAFDFVENMTAYAVDTDAYEVVPMPDFDAEYHVGAELEGKDIDYEEAFELPVELRGDLMLIRVGQLLPSQKHVVIATMKRGFQSLLVDGFAYNHHDLTLQTEDTVVEFQVGDPSRHNEGDT